MASRFWVGGTGTWDGSTTTHWAATSGGASGASVPGTNDSVIFDGNSGGGTVTVNTTVNSISITCGAFTGTLDFSANNNNVTLNSFSASGSATRTVNLGSGTWTITGTSGLLWDVSNNTGLTFSASSSTIVFSGNISGAGAAIQAWASSSPTTYGTIRFSPTGGGGGGVQLNYLGSTTITNLSFTTSCTVTFVNGATITNISIAAGIQIGLTAGNSLIFNNPFSIIGSPSAPHYIGASNLQTGSSIIQGSGTCTFRWCILVNTAFVGATFRVQDCLSFNGNLNSPPKVTPPTLALGF
jgi:hypothetical protein